MSFAKRQIAQTDLFLPTLGFGGAPLGGLFDAVGDDEAGATLAAAFDQGLTYVDTAPYYGFGKSERRVGDILRGRDYSLSTKVGRLLKPGMSPEAAQMGWPDPLPFHPVYDYSYDGIMTSFEQSLQRLGLDRIDILYVHDIGDETHGPDSAAQFDALKTGGYRALEALRTQGLVRAIGLGVNETAACMTALEFGDWDVFLLAGRYTLLEQDPLADLLPACLKTATSVVVGGPFNSGILVGGTTWNYGAAPDHIVARVAALTQVAQQHDVALAAAALHFVLGHPAVASVIPGLRSQAELTATLGWVRTDIPADFWTALKDAGLLHPDALTPTGNPFSP